jgi:hypothetical protein
VVGPDIGPGLTTSDLTISRGPGQSVSIFAGASGANGMNFGWDQGNLRAFVNAPVQSPITFTHGGVSERMRIATNGNVGIGTNNPATTLDVGGDINTSTQYNIGGNRVLSISGTTSLPNSNTYAGVGAGSPYAVSTNSFFGAQAGSSNQGGANSFFGASAGVNHQTGNFNSFFGKSAGGGGIGTSSGQKNSFFGSFAGSVIDGDFNSFFGQDAGTSISSGNNNSFFGQLTGGAATTANSVTLLGYAANVSDGLSNATAIGAKAQVTQSDSVVLGSINGTNGATANTRVGIGTTAPSSVLHIVSDTEQLITASTNWTGGNLDQLRKHQHQWQSLESDLNRERQL